MTATPEAQAFGVGDADLPMTTLTIRLPISWVRAIKTRALMDNSDQSRIIRQAIAYYAHDAELPLNGY